MARALRAWAINRGGKSSVRNLRYGPRTRLVRGIAVPRFNLKTHGGRSFTCTVAAPTIWKSLSLELRTCVSLSTFKFKLKVTAHLQTNRFVEILKFRLMYRSKHELSSKKILKNIKYWQRNGGFKFWPEKKLPV